MCGRVNVYDHEGVQALLDELGVEHWPTFTPRFNIAPTSSLDTLILENNKLQHRSMTWGIVPKWAQPGQFTSPLINARAETIREKPSFKNLLKSQRILIPINGFYEWIREDKQKTAVYIRPKNKPAMFLAGVYQEVPEKDAQCSFITTAANTDMAQIHHRMPVITEVDSALTWLGQSPEQEIDALMQPQGNDLLHMQVVSDFVNNARNEGPNCMQAMQRPQQGSLI